MIKFSRYKDESVLNTDSFDKRRFNSLYDMSKGMQQLAEKADMPGFKQLLGDIWAGLYKMNPVLKEEVPEKLLQNKTIMERIMNDENFEDHRIHTKLDDLIAAVGTVKFGEETHEWIKEQKQQNEEMQKLMEEIQKMQQDNHNGKYDENINQAFSELNQHLQGAFTTNGRSFGQAMAKAMQQTNNIKNSVKSLLGGASTGNQDAELKKVPLRDQIKLVETLSNDMRVKKVSEWAGRMKMIARKKQKSKHTESIDRSGVTLGNSVERLLPVELGMYMNPKTKLDFMRRFVEGETLQYEQKGNEALGKGPIILCLDQSGSMDHLDMQSKGFALALMSIAKRQKRDFCLIRFSVQTKIKEYPKGKITIDDMVALAAEFLGGGTNFERPLKQALTTINKSRFEKADVVFITDGEANVSDSFLGKFNKAKKEKKFNVLSLVIGSPRTSVESFSDKVVNIRNFEDEGAFEAFEI
ncbi:MULTISPECIES: vWA domain-containing protein [Bacillaceae]|uniref:vWA domain-containing protein n=1 Tax=Bacillaceae TaxID=186817 RepID=UPI0006938A60|nr:VWA domain-containing protein [Bacillus rubiinfantis]